MSDLTIALVGRPNSGKSSLYNALTGGSAHVGNYPGVTVDILEGQARLPSGKAATVADLPGFYSVEATVDPSTDEGVARKFLEEARARSRSGGGSKGGKNGTSSKLGKSGGDGKDGKSDADGAATVIVQVLDPTRLALGLRLTRELLRTRMPVVVALTHEDILAAEGRTVDVAGLSDALGVPVALVSTRGDRARAAVLAMVEDRARSIDDDVAVEPTDFDPADLARRFVHDAATEVERTRQGRTERLDRLLLHPVLGPFLFVGIMASLFAAVFMVADPASSLMDGLVGILRARLGSLLGKGLLASFLADGILGGAGTVLAFMPQIVILTIALELLEASGYLARGSFLVDRVLRTMGLSGRSFLPLLMGHACAVPAISATRVVRDPRERLTTILVLPLMTCSARLPTYGLVLATFFAHRSPVFRALVFVGLYFAGILTALVAALVLRRTATRGKGLPLVLEMPSYRLPQGVVALRKGWQASRRFLRDVGTTIVIVSAILWVLLTIPMPGVTRAADQPPIESSVAATVGRAIEPVTRPAGFDWRMNVGLIGSFGAREVMVSTMGVIFGVENAADDPAPLTARLRDAKKPDGSPLYGTRNGLALLAFFLLACQCMSTIAAIKRETRSYRWPLLVLVYTYVLAFVAAVLVFQLSSLLGAT